jgi:Mrp family chromosome partitioning ATPase/capsular polysaccharide biosynthesis protein
LVHAAPGEARGNLYKRLIADPLHSPVQAAEGTDWLQPPGTLHGLRRSVQTIRERIQVVLIGLAITLAVALLYLVTADKIYEAQAEILTTPVPSTDPAISTIGVITESADPTLDVETAAQLVDSPAVATRAAEDLDGAVTPRELHESVTVEPIPETNVVTVQAEGPTPEEARDRANAFATAAVQERRDEIRGNIDALLPRLEADLAAAGNSTAAESLATLVTQLTALRASGNPTIQVETAATEPTEASSPKTTLVLVAALLGGLGIGLTAAFLLQVLDPRLRREEQLRDLFNLPILARIPREQSREGPLTPERLTPAAREAYRTLRATLAVSGQREGGPRTILVGGAGASEGKSTTAINLAASLALSGHSVILIEADLRRPSIGKALGISPEQGIISVLLESVSLSDALVAVYNTEFKVLVSEKAGADFGELLSLPAAIRLVNEAERQADYVIIDSPPLTEVIDALQLARHADAVLMVGHLGHSRLNKIRQLGELLGANGIRPVGFALVGVSPGDGYGYYTGASAPERRSERREQVASAT